MGFGDVIMSMGEAKRLHASTKQKVLILRADGMPVRSDLFNGVPYIETQRGLVPVARLVNGPGARPYIVGKTAAKWTWRPYQPVPADIVFTAAEKVFAEPYRGTVMVEPNVKAGTHRNKAWSSIYWQQLDSAMHALGGAAKIPSVQCAPSGSQFLLHTKRVPTSTFREACAVLSVCRAFVGGEGGLHHAAAALGVPAVVIFGGFISPQVTGYASHRNLFTGTGLGCGMRVDCQHCREAMLKISPALVFETLKEILK